MIRDELKNRHGVCDDKRFEGRTQWDTLHFEGDIRGRKGICWNDWKGLEVKRMSFSKP